MLAAVSDILAALKRLVHVPSHSAPVDTCVNIWLKSAKRVLTLVSSDTAIAIATLNLKNELPRETQQVLLLALFGKLNKLNDHYLQHVIAALLATHWTKSRKENKTQLLAFLRKRQLTVWLEILRLEKSVSAEQVNLTIFSISRLSRSQRLCLLAHVFSSNKEKSKNSELFAHIVRSFSTHHRSLLTPLATLFSQPMPGAKVFAKGTPGALIDIQQNHGFVFMLSNDDADGQWIPISAIAQPTALYMPFEHFIAMYSDTADSRAHKDGIHFLPHTFAIQTPPRSLLAIIDELQKRDVEIPLLCEKIEKVQTFNRFLIQTASQDNRLQLPVKNITQAVMTYGIERVGDMLMQFALMERLTQNQFPLMSMCKQFTLISCSVASLLASISDTKFTPQSAALTMTFLCSPLFTLPGLKIATSLPVSHDQDFTINHAFRLRSTASWLDIASELAGKWHQSATWRAVIHNCNKSPEEVPSSLKKEHAIMLLAFSIAKCILFRGNTYALNQNITYKSLLNKIKIQNQSLITALENQSNLYFCPLHY